MSRLSHNQPPSPSPAPNPTPNPIPYVPVDRFTITIINLYGRRYEFTVTPRTLLRTLYVMMQRESGIHPQQMLFLLNNKSMPRIEDRGVSRPLSDFNLSENTTIHFVLRLGRSRAAHYRREDWFPPAQLEEAQRQLEILDIDDGRGDGQTYTSRSALQNGLPTHFGQPQIF